MPTDAPSGRPDDDDNLLYVDGREYLAMVFIAPGFPLFGQHARRALLPRPQAEAGEAWLAANTDPDDTTVVIGIDWSDTHRLPAVERNYAPRVVEAPMAEPPYMDKQAMIAWCRREGLEPPRMYAEGFPHANCQGGCVKAGQAQFKLLLERRPEVFACWEAGEQTPNVR